MVSGFSFVCIKYSENDPCYNRYWEGFKLGYDETWNLVSKPI